MFSDSHHVQCADPDCHLGGEVRGHRLSSQTRLHAAIHGSCHRRRLDRRLRHRGPTAARAVRAGGQMAKPSRDPVSGALAAVL